MYLKRRAKTIPKSTFDKMDFDFFVKHELENQNVSKSSIIQSNIGSDTDSIRERENSKTSLKASIGMMQYVFMKLSGELVIINQGFEENTNIEMLLEMPERKPLREKFEDGIRNKLFYEPTLEIFKEGITRMIKIKLADDIYQIKNMLEATITEMGLHGTFQTLKTKLDYNAIEAQEVHDIIYEHVKAVKHLKYLEGKLQIVIENFRNLKESWNEQLQILQESVDDCTIVSCIETRLVLKWVQTRLEQRETTISNKGNALTEQLTDLNKNYQNETDITSDIEEFLNYKIAEVDGLIEKWMTSCDTDIDAMDDEIQVLTEGNKVLEVLAENGKADYLSRKKEIEDYWEQKRLAAEAILLEQKKLKFAIRIQAWWRGTMVRRHLGPFRKRRRKGKGKKGAKGKKGPKGKK